MRLDPTTPLDPALLPYLAGLSDPATPLIFSLCRRRSVNMSGKVWEGHKLQITAIDPLAEAYNNIIDAYHLTPPVRTQPCAGEALSATFPEQSFDFVYARNAIDHAVDPLVCIREMVKVAKSGCSILLVHEENVGVKEKYHGLHHWNFTVEQGDFLFSDSAQHTCNVTSELDKEADVSASVDTGYVTALLVEALNVHPPTASLFHLQ